MSSKVLVADDSLTIQKVVSMTLSGDEFTLIECLNENDLVAKVSSQDFDLILIDFNLSDSRTGYQLCKEVSSISQKTPIMAMLGTFDSVQDGDLQEAGVQDKIIKPFESEKFIRKCRDLMAKGEETSTDEDFTSYEDPVSESSEEASSDDSADDDSHWVVDTPGVEFEISEELQDEASSDDVALDVQEQTVQPHPLESELASWGVSVPGIIGQDSEGSGLERPPVIESAAREESQEASPSEGAYDDVDLDENDEDDDDEVIEPAQEDLEYPDFKNFTETESLEQRAQSHLVPLDDLEPEQDLTNGSDDDATDPDIKIEGLDELQKEIENELSPDEFWATDSNEEQEALSDEGSISGAMENPVIEEEVESQGMVAEKPLESSQKAIEQVDIDELAEKIKERLMPALDDWAKKYCEQAVDKVAWEVIPDLAENLIRKEIQEISESVKD